jgi:hypothetical protein
MDRLKVMISSTIEDLINERETVDSAIRDFKFNRFRSETMESLSKSPRVVCDESARDCDIYILIIGERYGWIIPELGISVTEREYNIAKESNPEKVLFFVKEVDESTREPLLKIFLNKVSDFNTGYFRAKRFSNNEELYNQVKESISTNISHRIKKNHLSLKNSLSLPQPFRYLDYIILLSITLIIIGFLISNEYFKVFYLPTLSSLIKASSLHYKLILISFQETFLNSMTGLIVVSSAIILLYWIFANLSNKSHIFLRKFLGVLLMIISILLFFLGNIIWGFGHNSYVVLTICSGIISFYLLDSKNIVIVSNSARLSIIDSLKIAIQNYTINKFLAYQIPIFYCGLVVNNLLFENSSESVASLIHSGFDYYDFSLSYSVVLISLILLVVSVAVVKYYQSSFVDRFIFKPLFSPK